MVSYAENVSIWWRHHEFLSSLICNIYLQTYVFKASKDNRYTSHLFHYSDVIRGTMASQITSLTIVYSTVYSGVDQRKHQSSASLAFVRGIHREPVNSPHIWPVTRKMFLFDDVIMFHPQKLIFRCKIYLSAMIRIWVMEITIVYISAFCHGGHL